MGIAKNYLNAEELEVLNRIVTAYIEVTELQAKYRQMPRWRGRKRFMSNIGRNKASCLHRLSRILSV